MSFFRDCINYANDYKDGIGVLFTGGGLLGILHSFYRTSRDRRDELRWKRANESKQMVDSIHKHEKARAALNILDLVDVSRPGSHEEVVAMLGDDKLTYEQVLEAINQNLAVANVDEKILIDYFDWLFYFIDRIEQNINSKLFDFDDVKYVFLPYFIKITEDKQTTGVYLSFMKARMYYLALSFWKRYLTDKEIRSLILGNGSNYQFPAAALFSITISSSLHRNSRMVEKDAETVAQ